MRLLNDQKREDAELRGDVLQVLMLNSPVPATIDARLEDEFVTLTGTADWQYQSRRGRPDGQARCCYEAGPGFGLPVFRRSRARR